MEQFPHQPLLDDILSHSAALHRHLCPRQVLGARIGILGLAWHGLLPADSPTRFDNKRKRLFTIVETDGCGCDGISTAVDCWIGRRTLRVEDYGKLAATIVNRDTQQAVRIAPLAASRNSARDFRPDLSKWQAYMEGYRYLPDNLLLQVSPVQLKLDVEKLISKPRARALCASCGEEIMNEREVMVAGDPLCTQCAGHGYYTQEAS